MVQGDQVKGMLGTSINGDHACTYTFGPVMATLAGASQVQINPLVSLQAHGCQTQNCCNVSQMDISYIDLIISLFLGRRLIMHILYISIYTPLSTSYKSICLLGNYWRHNYGLFEFAHKQQKKKTLFVESLLIMQRGQEGAVASSRSGDNITGNSGECKECGINQSPELGHHVQGPVSSIGQTL